LVLFASLSIITNYYLPLSGALAVQGSISMFRNIISSVIATTAIFLYDFLIHSEQAIDWYKPIFVFCFTLVLSSYFGSNKTKKDV
jgi:hypothetical protein